MGSVVTREALSSQWAELCRDASLRNLPYKAELNAWGKLELSPLTNRRGQLCGHLAFELGTQLAAGRVLTGCPVLTEIGVRVADVAWASADFIRIHRDTSPYPSAPEICVEIVSPANTDAELNAKTQAYLAAGAKEVWVVAAAGSIRYFDVSGEKPASGFRVAVSLPSRLGP